MVINHHLILFMFLEVISGPTDIYPASCDHEINEFVVRSFLQVEHFFLFKLQNDLLVNVLCFMALKIIELNETENSPLNV